MPRIPPVGGALGDSGALGVSGALGISAGGVEGGAIMGIIIHIIWGIMRIIWFAIVPSIQGGPI